MLFGKLLFIVTAFFIAGKLSAQTPGCKDPAATNYNPAATVNDGSCTYAPTYYTPPAKVNPMNSLLEENSGLQWAGASLWTFNDGGGATAIYRIDTASNAILQTVSIGGATNVDWEDMAFDGTHFYIGDFGNNATGIRTDLKIYKFPLSAIAADYVANPTISIPPSEVAVINFSYSNQSDFTTPAPNNTRFDCEAMIADGGQLHLFTKNWVDAATVHYVINGTAAGTYSATPIETLNTGYLVTAADKAPGSNTVVLLGYQTTGAAAHFLHLLTDYSGGYFFNGNKRRIDLPNVTTMGQAEGICFRTATYGYISNERFSNIITVEQKLRWFNTAAFVPAYVLPVDLMSFTASKQGDGNVLQWQFASAVSAVEILYSRDGVNFTVIGSAATSGNGRFVHQPVAGRNCYRMAWQSSNGPKSSNIICLADALATGISTVALRKNGRLSFVLTHPTEDDYTIRLLSTDGRLVAQTRRRINATGYQAIEFAASLTANQLMAVQVARRGWRGAVLVRVEE